MSAFWHIRVYVRACLHTHASAYACVVGQRTHMVRTMTTLIPSPPFPSLSSPPSPPDPASVSFFPSCPFCGCILPLNASSYHSTPPILGAYAYGRQAHEAAIRAKAQMIEDMKGEGEYLVGDHHGHSVCVYTKTYMCVQNTLVCTQRPVCVRKHLCMYAKTYVCTQRPTPNMPLHIYTPNITYLYPQQRSSHIFILFRW